MTEKKTRKHQEMEKGEGSIGHQQAVYPEVKDRYIDR